MTCSSLLNFLFLFFFCSLGNIQSLTAIELDRYNADAWLLSFPCDTERGSDSVPPDPQDDPQVGTDRNTLTAGHDGSTDEPQDAIEDRSAEVPTMLPEATKSIRARTYRAMFLKFVQRFTSVPTLQGYLPDHAEEAKCLRRHVNVFTISSR